MTALRSSLARHLGSTPMDEAEVRRLAAAVWHRKGVALIDPANVRNDFARQAIVTEAERQYGKRDTGGGNRP